MNPIFKKQRDKLFHLKTLRRGPAEDSSKSAAQQKGQVCPFCGHVCTQEELQKQMLVCRCGHHFAMDAYTRLHLVLDEGSLYEMGKAMKTADWLHFPGYPQKLKAQREKSHLEEGVVTARGRIDDVPVVVAVMDTRFMMGSMGTTVGEKITLAVEYATRKKLPLIIFCASGGARMQEGIMSLMQMAKTSAALDRFSQKGGLYIAYLTHPTTGGVTASFAMLGDITLAEPDALIGFAGPRVIEQTIGETLPEGFQRSEFQEDHGFVDSVVERRDMKATLSKLLRLHRSTK